MRAEIKECGPAAADWAAVAESLDARGYATIANFAAPAECRALTARYPDDAVFRSRVVMQRHNFGSGEYKYFDYPLPQAVAAWRSAAYPPLAAIANGWNARLGLSPAYPPTLDAYLAQCHAAGQRRPTPLLLKYAAGDYNCLHQDLYGELLFPLQITVLLSDPAGFSGGEFVLVEQRPRAQSRAEIVKLRQGEAVIFPVRHRPVQGARGAYRATMRHGVSRVHSGERHTLGLIFHDAA